MSKPELKHPFIRDLKRGPHKDSFKRVLASKFGKHHYWSRREFEKLHGYKHFLAISTNRTWLRMLSIREKVYHELVLEFYTTFWHEDTTEWADSKAVKFRLSGEPRSMSYHDLAVALELGLDDDEDNVTELHNLESVNFKVLYTLLAQSGQPPFHAGRMKASTLQLDNFILHNMLGKSFTPAGDSASTLTRRYMYFIHSIRTADHPHHLGSMVAKTLDKSALQLGTLHCTPLITRLATYFQIPLQGCTEQGDTSVFGKDTISKMHLLRVERAIKWIAGFPAPPLLAEDQPDVPEDEATEYVHPDDVDAADAPRQTNFEYGGASSTFPSQDYFTHQFHQPSLQNQQLLDHHLQFQQQYSAHQAEYNTRMAAYDERLDNMEAQQGVTLAHIEREHGWSRCMQEVQQHLLQLIPSEQPVWRTHWEDSPFPPPSANDDAFMDDIVATSRVFSFKTFLVAPCVCGA
ncbi:unnamed protein product [Linum trigynum]|uniref:Uncharacterized protein n=1 Tax=Linum trigynum TaxID=586398 RepID=A0AAV2D6R0_9ROSI